MDTEKIQSFTFMEKQANTEVDSRIIFNKDLYIYRLDSVETNLAGIKSDIKEQYYKFEESLNRLDDKVESKYNKLENRQYRIFFTIIAAIIAEIISRIWK